jgi:hypothetical protein
MGPCWLDIEGLQQSRQAHTWCKLEVRALAVLAHSEAPHESVSISCASCYTSHLLPLFSVTVIFFFFPLASLSVCLFFLLSFTCSPFY